MPEKLCLASSKLLAKLMFEATVVKRDAWSVLIFSICAAFPKTYIGFDTHGFLGQIEISASPIDQRGT